MKHRQLGANGPSLSALGLGAMGMSQSYGERDDVESVATIQRALDLGVNFIDTADVYGQGDNEKLVGEAIGKRRGEVIIATKFGFVLGVDKLMINGRPEYARQACDASLKRLGVDVIDLYYIHRVDPEVAIEETIGAMADLITAGKVLMLGLSEVSPKTLRRAHAVHPIAALQSEYSLWTRDPEPEVLAACREMGVTFVPFSPLGRGFLTGSIKDDETLPVKDARRGNPRFQGENLVRNLALVSRIEEMSKEKGCTAAQLALAWVLSRGDDIIPIPGTKRRKYLEENLASLEIEMTAEDLARIDEIAPPNVAAGPRYADDAMKLVDRE